MGQGQAHTDTPHTHTHTHTHTHNRQKMNVKVLLVDNPRSSIEGEELSTRMTTPQASR